MSKKLSPRKISFSPATSDVGRRARYRSDDDRLSRHRSSSLPGANLNCSNAKSVGPGARKSMQHAAQNDNSVPAAVTSNTKQRDKAAKDKAFRNRYLSNAIVLSKDDETLKSRTALAFATLSKENSEELLTMEVDHMESKLKEIFSLSPSTELRDAAILDYYVGAIYWGKGQGHTAQQLSGFFSIIHILMEKIRDEQSSFVETFKTFRKMLVGITADLGPDVESGGLEFFTADQAKAITQYLHCSLFQHFKLYELMFSQPQTMEIITSDLQVEVPPAASMPFPPPLDEGIAEETYQEFLSIPTPSLTAQSDEVKGLEEEAPPTPIQVELPPEVKDIFTKLTPDDVRTVVEEVSREILANLQSGVENKMRQYENNMLSRINKIHVVLPEKTEEAAADK